MGEIERAIADLEEVLAGVGGGVPARFVEGHGLESRRFRFNWDGRALKLDFDLPCWRVLADEGGGARLEGVFAQDPANSAGVMVIFP